MKIELAQIPGREGRIGHNLERALRHVRQCGDDTDLVVFPETHLTGFAQPGTAADTALSPEGTELRALHDAAVERDLAIAIGFLERGGDGRIFNASVLVTPEDGVALHYRKTHLWTDERELVDPGDSLVCTVWRGCRIGLLICYDLEFPEPARALAAMGTELLLITNGNMDPYGPVHRSLAEARAIENQMFVAMTNRVGTGAGYTFAGGSAAFAPDGQCIAALGRQEGTARVALDFSLSRSARHTYDYLSDRRLSLAGDFHEDDRSLRRLRFTT